MIYEFYKDVWDNTKPMRGKPDIRPLTKRRDKNRLIVRVVNPDGSNSYAATLYGTTCVTVHADNTFDVCTGGWSTITTANFISGVLKRGGLDLDCIRHLNKLWLFKAYGDLPKYPLNEMPCKFSSASESGLEPVGEFKVSQRVIDRKVTKTYYDKIEPFFAWAEMFLKLSDGWLMNETRLAIFPHQKHDTTGNPTGRYDYDNLPERARGLLQRCQWNGHNADSDQWAVDYLCNQTEDDYLMTLCILAHSHDMGYNRNPDDNHRIAETFPFEDGGYRWAVQYYDVRLNMKHIKSRVQGIVKSLEATKKIVLRDVSGSYINNVL